VIWTEEEFKARRFVQRLWRLVHEAGEVAALATPPAPSSFGGPALALRKSAHRALARVTEDIERLRFNVAIAHIYQLANQFQASLGGLEAEPAPDYRWAAREAADILVLLLHPMMPHPAEDCRAALGHKASWPQSLGRGGADRWSRTASHSGPNHGERRSPSLEMRGNRTSRARFWRSNRSSGRLPASRPRR
jgi:leucyl-tRNA synthetase